MERGAVGFWEFYEFICDRAGYRGSIREFHGVWSDFFDGPIPGAEEVLERVRERYRVAFLSNSNEVHAELIPRTFRGCFTRTTASSSRTRFKVAKPDPESLPSGRSRRSARCRSTGVHRRPARKRAAPRARSGCRPFSSSTPSR